MIGLGKFLANIDSIWYFQNSKGGRQTLDLSYES